MLKLIGIVALFNPTALEMENIRQYVSDLDYCILMDDSESDNITLCNKLIEEHNGKIEYIRNRENIGLVASVNHGIECAMEKRRIGF